MESDNIPHQFDRKFDILGQKMLLIDTENLDSIKKEPCSPVTSPITSNFSDSASDFLESVTDSSSEIENISDFIRTSNITDSTENSVIFSDSSEKSDSILLANEIINHPAYSVL